MSIDTGNNISTLGTAITSYQTNLDKDIKSATSARKASEKRLGSSQNQLQNKTCSYLKYKATKELYLNIDQTIAISAKQEAELIKSSVDTITGEAKNLMGQLAALSKTLKSAKTEVYKIKEEACNLVDCCLDKELHEVPELHQALTSGDIPDLMDQLAEIKKQAERSYTIADITFSAIIDVSGIQGFVSLDSLKTYSDDLFASLESFKKDIDDNCKKLNTSIETVIKERGDLLVGLSTNKFDNFDNCCIELALCDTWNQSCDDCGDKQEKPEAGKAKLEEICSKFKEDLEIEEPEPGKKRAKPNLDKNGPTF